MKTVIYCRPTAKGVHSFYLTTGAEEFFLFSQAYRKGVEEFYGKGVFFNDAMNYSKAQNDSAITRTMSKRPMYVRYLEKEYGIEVLERTKKKFGQSYSRVCCA